MDVYLGTIMQVGFNFAPVGWATCSGQLMPISQNEALFALLGVNFGGDGQSSFGLPNLQGRMTVGVGSSPGNGNYVIGQTAGQTSVVLTQAQLPAHSHSAVFTPSGGGAPQVTLNAVQTVGGSGTPSAGALLAESGTTPSQPKIYAPAGTTATQVPLGGITVTGGGGSGTVQVGPTGNGAPVPTMPPYLAIQNIIAISGLFPSRA